VFDKWAFPLFLLLLSSAVQVRRERGKKLPCRQARPTCCSVLSFLTFPPFPLSSPEESCGERIGEREEGVQGRASDIPLSPFLSFPLSPLSYAWMPTLPDEIEKAQLIALAQGAGCKNPSLPPPFFRGFDARRERGSRAPASSAMSFLFPFPGGITTR